ncbi:uncharacterized protein LOC105168273 isoform X1 [Sesamum indicum]|uniref:Uncharacterized protein LOC105168273 isoform X1 n=1 Tax=Sesamum indicum TaxID=4182 RepID=A0A6I9TYM2_SESIN|nr:uncharacterized protein LOC105168273 isoform X1 [Sesamum indicum]
MAADTTAPSYWLNWRFLLCAIWILVAMMIAALLIWRYEGRSKPRYRQSGDEQEAAGCLYDDEVWGTCSKSIHPIWMLAYRIVAFSVLLALLLADIIIHSGRKYYFYTQWTFTLVTLYFGLGSSLSIHGCLRYHREAESRRHYCVGPDADHGSYVPLGENADLSSMTGSSNHHGEPNWRTAASAWGYVFQIVFQMCAGAVALTDIVFWSIIYPSLITRNYRLTFLVLCMHSVNAVLLLGDAILNSLRFPFFRIAYFVLWTCIYVIFQWIIHAFVSMRWPYSFLDLSSPYAPLWYFAIGLLVFPCFGIFIIIFRVKQCYLAR